MATFVECRTCARSLAVPAGQKVTECPACGSLNTLPAEEPATAQSAPVKAELTCVGSSEKGAELREKVCRTCKFTFGFPMAEGVFPCPACGTVNGRPEAEGASYDHLKRATRQRLFCDFHNAEISYQHVLLEYPEEHEAYWGLVLCRYGVEYVEDLRTGKPIPTVHSIRKKPMQADSDFLAACEYAPEKLRVQYEAEATYIDDAMAGIRRRMEAEAPYDVFICHKKTVPGSENLTPEYGKAAEMAHHLEKQGYRVFFAPEAIKDELGADYEAEVYHALDTAKVMLMFCANEEYVTSAWVRSEWTRFLEMTTERENKRLVPLLYGEFTPARLPREIRPYRLECVTMDSFTAASDVLRLLEKCCGKRESEKKTPVPIKPEETQKRFATVKRSVDYVPEKDFDTEGINGGCVIMKYKGQGGNVNVPPTIGGRNVVAIWKEAFKGCINLTSIALPQSVTSIGDGAFRLCTHLTSIVLPKGLKSIGELAFAQCISLTSITLPENLMLVREFTFAGCNSLTNVKLPESVTSIKCRAFWRCISLTSVMLPKCLTSIGREAFGDCSSLREIHIPDKTQVAEDAFSGCPMDRS